MPNYLPATVQVGGAPETISKPVVPAVTQVERAVTSTSTYTRQGTPVWVVSSNTLKTAVIHTLTDDGQGGFIGTRGTADYAGKHLLIKFAIGGSTTAYQADYENAAAFNAATITQTGTGANLPAGSNDYAVSHANVRIMPGSKVVVKYRTGPPVPVNHVMSWAPPAVPIDLCPYTNERIVPGSVRFSWMGTVYEDYEGQIYRGRTASSPGIVSGTLDYEAGVALMTDYVVSGSPTNFTLLSLWTSKPAPRVASIFGMTDTAPIVPGMFSMRVQDAMGELIEITSDVSGNLVGPHTLGKVNFEQGIFEAQFGDFLLDSALTPAEKSEWWYKPEDVGAVVANRIWRPWPIDPGSARLGYTSRFYLPIDPEILGLPPERLPTDGRVPIHAKGRMLCIGHTGTLAPASYSNGATVNLGRPRVGNVWVIDANGQEITAGYEATEAQLNLGQIKVTDTTGWAQPVTVRHRIYDFTLCTDVQIDGTLSINPPLSHDYPVGSVVSSVLLFGNLFARVANLFDQKTWDGVTFKDSAQGDVAVGTYNEAASPIIVTNAGALSERYGLRFRNNATDFDLIGEKSGGLGSGNKNEDFRPSNPMKPGTPLMVIPAAGWGSNWAGGETLFAKTIGAMGSFAAIRSVQPSVPTGQNFHCEILVGGDIDRTPSAP